jgi:hypothetical protein
VTKDKRNDPIDLDESWRRFNRRFGIEGKQPELEGRTQSPSPDTDPATTPAKALTTGTQWSLVVLLVVGFLLFFHVIPTRMTVFPKESPSFANTFIDLAEYLKQYNSGSFIDQIAIRQTYLFQQLKARGLIIEETK